MPRRAQIPTYRLHKQSGQAVVTLPDGLGGRRDVLLGPHGSPASRAEYARVIAEWEANGRRPPGTADEGLSVNELILAFLRHAQEHYRRPDGTPTGEVGEYKVTLRTLKALYGHTPAADFGPLALKAVREKFVGAGWSRGVVNQRVGRVKRVYKWAVENELVPVAVYEALRTVAGIGRGRSKAPETVPVQPVALAVVEETLPHASRHVRAMAEVQLLTGARPGEVCAMRACDIDTTGHVWLYRPGSDRGADGQHKTAHHGRGRIIAIGPKAQATIKPFLKLDTRAYLFSPREAREEFDAGRRKGRKTPMTPSQAGRKRKRKPRRRPGDRYRVSSYAHAIGKAVLKANTALSCDACKPREPEDRCAPCKAAALPHWHPHQLRHTRATEIRRQYGLEAAQVILGHAKADVTQVYAERDLDLATRIMEEVG
jgi:integrase